MVKERELFLGSSYRIGEHIVIENPTIGEVIAFDEEKYFNLVSRLISTPFDYKSLLYDMDVDYEDTPPLLFFHIMIKDLKPEDTNILLGDLDLSKFRIMFNKDTNEYVLYNSVDEIMIDEATYTEMTDCIRKMHCIEKQNCIPPSNEYEKQYLIGKERFDFKLRKDQPFQPVLFPWVSVNKSYLMMSIATFCMLGKYNCLLVFDDGAEITGTNEYVTMKEYNALVIELFNEIEKLKAEINELKASM